MRKQQKKTENQAWGSFTREQADNHYDKLGLKCATREEYKRWFVQAERCNTRCRTLKSFCKDCCPAFQQEMIAEGNCINPKFDTNGSKKPE